jgi:hypothetical protein
VKATQQAALSAATFATSQIAPAHVAASGTVGKIGNEFTS